MRPGQVERRTDDRTRRGTTSLFAAPDTKSGAVIGRFQPRHRARDSRCFLNSIDANVPAGIDIHLVLENNGTHKTPIIHRWLAAHPRYHVHFTLRNPPSMKARST